MTVILFCNKVFADIIQVKKRSCWIREELIRRGKLRDRDRGTQNHVKRETQ